MESLTSMQLDREIKLAPVSLTSMQLDREIELAPVAMHFDACGALPQPRGVGQGLTI